MKNSRVRLRYEILETPGLKPAAVSAEEFRRKFQGSTAKVTPPQYTGDQMLGVATMHKSNAVPVFNTAAARDISNMRR
jgi:hypothetical protein